MDRRTFLGVSAVSAASVAFGGSLWRGAFAPAVTATGPYGPLLSPDGNGLQLPAGFTSRIVARTGEPVGDASYCWHEAPDGGACFPDGHGWIYVSNSEVRGTGGAGAVRFDAGGQITGAWCILDGTDRNCAGGPTTWGTWLSCEEVTGGRVYEADPRGERAAVVRPAMGRFKHEAAAVDPLRRVVYLTEDESDGCLYRFRPSSWKDLSDGALEVLCEVDADSGVLAWARVPDPAADREPTREQVPSAKRFDGGEGAWFSGGSCWFTTKGDNRVWRYDAERNDLAVVYGDRSRSAPLNGVDNITRSQVGELFVAEDTSDMEICTVTTEGAAPFLRIDGHNDSEVTGPAFSPDGTRLYFSSQRGEVTGDGGGVTFEVRGPFRRRAALPPDRLGESLPA